jgi:hypothetical protein
LAKTLRELQNTRDWPALYPEIHTALQETLEKFRQTYIALSNSIAPVKKSLAWSGPAIPQIKLPAFPDWLHDLIAASKGNLEAATQLCNHISTPQGMNRDVLPQAVLRVLSHVEYDLPAYLGNGTHWRDDNGTLKKLTPDHWLPYEVLEWLKIEALSSIWDPNSRASPVYCWDEETPQNHRTRTRPNRLVVGRWDHPSGDGQAAWPKSIQHFCGAETKPG